MQLPSRAPESVVADAIADVSRLESAISVLGEDNPHARPLLDALRVAKTQATVPPIHDRIKACKAFLDRARKRVCRAEAVIASAVEQKMIFDGEVADGEKRLQELLEEEVNVPVPVPSPRVAELQQQIDDLVRERELLRASQTRIPREQPGEWCADCPPVPLDHAELEGWIIERNCDLRNALEFGDAATISQIGNLLSQGITQFARSSKDVVMGQSRSSLMESMIEESDAKRRLVQVGSVPSALPSMVGNQV